ncbi:MAG: uroporphyrinogen decarboxylase family protein [Candidatus Abyssubacteria bacterium]
MSTSANASRQRVVQTLNHREPDRIPFDLGSSIETGITVQAYDRFIELMNLKEEPDDTLFNSMIDAGGFKQIPENVLRALKVDTRGTLIQPLMEGARIEFEGDTLVIHDEWGVKWAKPQSSLYMDPIDHPLKGELTRERLKNFPWPDPAHPERFAGIHNEARRLRDTGCAVMFSLYGLGIFEIAWMLHGLEATLMDMALNPPLMEELFDRIADSQMLLWQNTLETVGENVDVCLHSEDLGTQRSPIMSPQMYRTFLKPRHARLFAHIKKVAKNDVKLLMHSCGSVRDLLPDLIEAGIDALNPIQVSATGMDTRELKKEFGKDLCFWGGGVDTQEILPHGSTSQVRDEVKRRIDDLAPGGGFVFAAVHNIQPDVPPENIRTMWETFQEYCAY